MKRIMIDRELCMGCRNCQLACMAGHSAGKSVLTLDLENPANQPLNQVEAGPGGRPVPLLCRHCSSPDCVKSCISGALSKSPGTGEVLIHREKCAGCFMCVMTCAFGMPRPDYLAGVSVKCDFCPGSSHPRCVAACPTGALWLGELGPEGTVSKITPGETNLCGAPEEGLR